MTLGYLGGFSCSQRWKKSWQAEPDVMTSDQVVRARSVPDRGVARVGPGQTQVRLRHSFFIFLHELKYFIMLKHLE